MEILKEITRYLIICFSSIMAGACMGCLAGTYWLFCNIGPPYHFIAIGLGSIGGFCLTFDQLKDFPC